MSRLYEEFEKKNTAFKHRKFNTKDHEEEFFIAIPFKNTEGSKKKFILDEEFIKVIEQEYATKYLEANGTVAS
jgi:hypothetical protein